MTLKQKETFSALITIFCVKSWVYNVRINSQASSILNKIIQFPQDEEHVVFPPETNLI